MKVLKVILLLAVILFGAWLVLCAMAPASIKTSRSITIQAQADQVYPWIVDLAEWEAWSPWQNKDSTMVNVISEPSMGAGATMSWTSEDMGTGSMRITAVIPNQKVSTALTFSGYDQPSYAHFNLTELDGETIVEWTMDGGEVAYLFRGFLVLMDAVNRINADYEEGLATLKRRVEREPMRFQEIELDFNLDGLVLDSLQVDSLRIDSLRVDSIPMPGQ